MMMVVVVVAAVEVMVVVVVVVVEVMVVVVVVVVVVVLMVAVVVANDFAGGYLNDVWVWFAESSNIDRILYDTSNPAQVISRRQDASAVVWGTLVQYK